MGSERACISVVDDDALVLRSLDRLLQSADMRCAPIPPAGFPRAARRRHSGCMVMDLSMPGLNGLELQQALASAPTAGR